jgi:mono/diheme cytochrome c family protein
MKSCWGAIATVTACLLLNIGCSGGPPISAESFTREVTDFHELYSRNCTGCHGVDGMKGAAPRLNNPLYLAVVDRDTLYNTIRYGRPGTPMPAFGKDQGGNLSDKQISALIDGIQREWTRQVDFGGVEAPTYSVAKAPAGDAQRGQTAYQENCMACHGFREVKGAAGSILDPNFLALVSDQGLRTTMIVGRPDWGMPDWRHRIPNHVMTDQEMSDVGAWLASQRPEYASLATQGGPAAPHPPAPHITTSEGQAQSKEGK